MIICFRIRVYLPMMTSTSITAMIIYFLSIHIHKYLFLHLASFIHSRRECTDFCIPCIMAIITMTETTWRAARPPGSTHNRSTKHNPSRFGNSRTYWQNRRYQDHKHQQRGLKADRLAAAQWLTSMCAPRVKINEWEFMNFILTGDGYFTHQLIRTAVSSEIDIKYNKSHTTSRSAISFVKASDF